jgi:hypothetical protein
VTEFATFRTTVATTTTTSSLWSNESTWALLAAVGLLAGLVVGIAIRRMRSGSGGNSGSSSGGSSSTGDTDAGPTGGTP